MSTTTTVSSPTSRSSSAARLVLSPPPSSSLDVLARGIPLEPMPPPPPRERDPRVPHAPLRVPNLNEEDTRIAMQNALRYFPEEVHAELAPEFLDELHRYGHIYMYRFRLTEEELPMRAYPIHEYPGRSLHARAIMLMIMNNLDPAVAQFPHELITYGGNGSVFSNWAQFRLVMKYLSEMTDEQTLVMYSGHPMGLFPSHPNAPRVVVSNGLMVPHYSRTEDYDRLYAMGVTQYGQMTAGSYCYIGPQGIVHGTTLTLLNAGRKYLKDCDGDLTGRVFVTSGAGGMSGAQGKASVITKAIGIVAEVAPAALEKRHKQGWVQEIIRYSLDELVERIRRARVEKKPVSIGFLGNVVDVWERLVEEHKKTGDLLADLGSDQTSLHNPFNGGYYPTGLSFDDANVMMVQNPPKFKQLVQESLRRHATAVNYMCEHGMAFWDYGNAFLLQASLAGADVMSPNPTAERKFKYPSYVQDIMGDIFSLGFGPFRWVCTSGDAADLELTDRIAMHVIEELDKQEPDLRNRQQYRDNHLWIEQAGENRLVVGSQARILYSNSLGRARIALAFNDAIRDGKLKGPVVLSRDHHDVSGADSPWRETSNIYDGSQWTADMSFHTVIGDAMRGATYVALHNGGGVGWGEVQNCGFGLVLDGTDAAADRARNMLFWDVNNGVARRAWSQNQNALDTIRETMKLEPRLQVTLPHQVDAEIWKKLGL